MSEWTPKVGDKVMVGECGPYFVHRPLSHSPGCWDLRNHLRFVAKDVPSEWLTPAPEPEPDEPPAPGALVRVGEHLAVQRGAPYDKPWLILTGPLQGSVQKWSELTASPITILLAEPAEVEKLRADLRALGVQYDKVVADRDSAEAVTDRMRAEVDGLREDVKHAEARADELQRRIDRALAMLVGVADEWTDVFYKQGAILRGES